MIDEILSCMQDSKFHQALVPLLTPLASSGSYFVGGVVRDFVLDLPPHQLNDLDFIVTGSMAPILTRARREGWLLNRTGFGNPRLWSSVHNVQIDMFPPADPTGAPLPLRQALGYCDANVQAIAVGLLEGDVVDPFHGVYDAVNAQASLLTDCWEHPASLHSELLAKIPRISDKSGLEFKNLEVADDAASSLRMRWCTLDSVERIAVEAYLQWREAGM